jgi:hypothetical protein
VKTYGSLILHRGLRRWEIADLAPHVAIAFKRLFPRVPETATKLHLSDTDEIRADLQWFMARYPLAHDHAAELADGAQRVACRIAERDRILLPTWSPGEVTGFRQGMQPYVYQSQAAKIAIDAGGLLLGDDVGLGKTISAAATLTMGAPMPAAVVVQPHLARQWEAQLAKFTTLRVHTIKGTRPYDLPPADVYVFRYSNVAGWTDVIKEGLFKTVVYDEVQELRHGASTSKGQACRTLSSRADLRLGLTATPIYNYGDEIHSVMDYIRPGLLGDSWEFVREWCSGSKQVKNPDGLGSYLRDTGYFLRRTEDDPSVDATMPRPNIIDWMVDWDNGAVRNEEAITRALAIKVLSGDFVEAGSAARELDLKMRMMTGIAKARSVAAYVKLLLRDSPRVLLAGWHRDVYQIWRDELAAFNPTLYTGSESAAGKARTVEAFTTGDSRVMMLSLRSGAGLDGLQHYCRDVVFGELDWSPQVHYQVIGRLRRPGQLDQVTAHYLHTNDGSDPVLIETLGVKSDQSRGINDPGIAPAAKFTDDSRIKRLAQHVLGMGGVEAAAA